VYRGTRYSDISGLYFFADYCSGLIGTVDGSNTVIDHGDFSGNWVSFGEDVNKELYIVSIGGSIYSIQGGVLGTSENSEALALSMYPNPAENNVNFSMENDTISSIKIYDVRGSVVSEKNGLRTSTTMLSTSQLRAGVYMVSVTAQSGHTITKKLVVR
jgi:hypothetical protein